MTVPANPWMALLIGILAVATWLGILGVVWALLYADGERDARHIRVEAER